MRIRSGWRLLMTGSARLARRLATKGRNGVAVGMAVVMAIALTVVAVVLAGHTTRERRWTAVGQRCRAPAPGPRRRHDGPDRERPGGPRGGLAAAAGARCASTGLRVKGAVPAVVRPKPPRLPARGKVADKTRVLRPPAPGGQARVQPEDQPRPARRQLGEPDRVRQRRRHANRAGVPVPRQLPARQRHVGADQHHARTVRAPWAGCAKAHGIPAHAHPAGQAGHARAPPLPDPGGVLATIRQPSWHGHGAAVQQRAAPIGVGQHDGASACGPARRMDRAVGGRAGLIRPARRRARPW